jgi:hypothetical protein
MSYPVMSTSVPWSLVKGGFKKTPHFESIPQKAAAGRGLSTLALMPYPTWDFDLDLNMVLGGEAIAGSVLQSFLGCYMACCGGGAFFLFTDPNDNAVAAGIGVMLNVTPGAATPMGQLGDGVSTQFQLARTVGQGLDILQNTAITQVKVNGTPTSAYSVSATGVITFTTAPAASATITWSGSFQYLCKFKDDTLKDLARVNKNTSGFLWSCSSIQFESIFI